MPQRDKPSRKKRANGEGSWFERVRTLPTGTVVKDWVFIVSLGIDPLTGKRIRRSFHGKRKSDVLLKYERAREQQGGVKRPDPLTVETYLKAWLLEVERFKSGPTKRFYEGRIRACISAKCHMHGTAL